MTSRFVCLGSEWGVTGLPMLLQPSWHDVVPAAVTADQAAARPTPTDLEELQQNLKCGWTVHVAQNGRLYYCKWVKHLYFIFKGGLNVVLDRFNVSLLRWKIFTKWIACCTLWMRSAMSAGLAVGTNKARTCLWRHNSRGVILAIGFSADIYWQYRITISWLYFLNFEMSKKFDTEMQTSVGKNRDKKRGLAAESSVGMAYRCVVI